ncbi:MAG: UDP-3-O-acyl-N-acetylglucosamine deacetylase [Anaerolineae bacterium]
MTSSCELAVKNRSRLAPHFKRQRSLRHSVSVEGIGLFTGEKATLRLSPLEVNKGIVFQRADLPTKPHFPAHLDFLRGTSRCTILGREGAFVQTVEHLLAALSAYGIDNLLIEITGSEVPILDGSSIEFVDLIERGEIWEQGETKPCFKLSSPLFWSQGDIHLIALPCDEYRISYTLHYPHSSFIRSQFCSIVVDAENFKKEIAPCRTFSLYEEIAPLIEKGMIKGSLQNGVIIKENAVLNPEGLRFPDEMVRHKILDLIGELSLVPYSFLAHIIAIRSGHASNSAFATVLNNHIKMESS